MKNVAFAVPSFPVLSETFVQTEVEAVQEAGNTVTVFTFDKVDTELKFPYDVVQIGETRPLSKLVGLRLSGLVRGYKFAKSQKLQTLKSLFLHGSIFAIQMAERGVQHVHAHFGEGTTAYAIMAAKLLGITCSFVGHGHDIYETPNEIDKKLEGCDFAIAVCQDMRRDFLEMADVDVRLLHCGVRLDRFVWQEKEPDEDIKLLFVGRLVFQKGVQYLLEALAQISISSSITLDIIGDGEMRVELEQQARELNLSGSVKFHGSKPHRWVQQNLSKYDCMVAPFCFSPTGSVDTGPLVLKEAMAVGTPVITTTIMGCKEICVPGTGYAVNEKNVLELKNAIESFANLTHKERVEMGRLARQHVVENFDALKQGKQLSEWIENLGE